MMARIGFALALAFVTFAAVPLRAAVPPFPKGFQVQEIAANGATIHMRVGGHGPAVVLLHGYGETGDMWAPMAADLMRDHPVIVPDLRGLGLSSKPKGGFDKKTQAGDVAGVMDQLSVKQADLVTHDIGNMVGFAFAAQHPERVRRFVLIDAPVPGVGPWEEIIKNPLLWHFRFGGPDMERLVKGRERIYLDRFWNDFSADPTHFDEASRQHYARLYALPGRDAFGLRAIPRLRPGRDRQPRACSPRTASSRCRCSRSAARSSFGPQMADVMRAAAADVTAASSPIRGTGSWKRTRRATVKLVREFLDRP